MGEREGRGRRERQQNMEEGRRKEKGEDGTR